MAKFYFDDDREEKIKFIKKIVAITIVFIIIFLILRSCTNHLTNKIREDIENEKNEKIKKIEQQETEIDLKKPFSYYNIKTDSELQSFIEKLSSYLRPIELYYYIDFDDFSLKHDWDKYNNVEDYLNILSDLSYYKILKLLLNHQVNYSEAPLTEHFRKKFKNGFLGEYSYLCDVAGWTSYDYEKRYFVLSEYKGEAQDDYYFNFILDKEGYLDDVVLDHVKHVIDEYGEKIPEIDKYLMNDEQVINDIIKWLCIPLKYGKKTAPVDAWYHAYDEDLEYGFTDRFREYSKNLRPNGLLGYEDYESFSIERIDMNMKTATVKVGLEDKYVYYDIVWTTDDNYRMDAIEAKINREEKK